MCEQCEILRQQHELDNIVIANRNAIIVALIGHIKNGYDISAYRLDEIERYTATRYEPLQWETVRRLHIGTGKSE